MNAWDNLGSKKSLPADDIISGYFYQGTKGGDVRRVVRRVGRAVTYTRPGKVLTLTTNVTVFAKWATRRLTEAEWAKEQGCPKWGPRGYG